MKIAKIMIKIKEKAEIKIKTEEQTKSTGIKKIRKRKRN